MLQIALLAALTNVAIGALASAQDPVVFNTTSPLFAPLTNCGTSGPLSCGGEDRPQEDLCCYEDPRVSCCIRYMISISILARVSN